MSFLSVRATVASGTSPTSSEREGWAKECCNVEPHCWMALNTWYITHCPFNSQFVGIHYVYTDQPKCCTGRWCEYRSDCLITMQWSAGKSQGLAIMWVPPDTDYPSKHRCGQSTPPHGKDTLPWQWPHHHDNASWLTTKNAQKEREVESMEAPAPNIHAKTEKRGLTFFYIIC